MAGLSMINPQRVNEIVALAVVGGSALVIMTRTVVSFKDLHFGLCAIFGDPAREHVSTLVLDQATHYIDGLSQLGLRTAHLSFNQLSRSDSMSALGSVSENGVQ